LAKVLRIIKDLASYTPVCVYVQNAYNSIAKFGYRRITKGLCQ